MRKLYALKDMLCDELKEYADKGKLDMPSLEVVDKLAHACKNVIKIIERCEEENGYSNASYSNGYYPNMHQMMPNYSYNDGYSNGMSSGARGRGPNASRDSMGRYSSAGDFRMEFQNLLNDAPNERVRQEMMKIMNNEM